ncbi:hypothetical protein [Micromonospora sp. NPDC005161]
MSALARAAVTALAPFGRLDRRTARALLSTWARRAELTRTDVAAVLAEVTR